jgi:hypothetical protein
MMRLSLVRWNAFCIAAVAGLQLCSGERHENLSADGADGYTFDGDSFHFSARTAVENASAIARLLKA